MGILTALFYGALLVYMGGWIMDLWIGNFALLLLILSLVTFAYWLAERFYFHPARLKAAHQLTTNDQARRAALSRQGLAVDGDVGEARERILAQPWWLDWTAGLFPVIVSVFLLRSFVVEPFKIPSGSMLPTLQVGDLILVNKYHFGIRLPVINRKVIDNNAPKRGDVAVFRFPLDPRIDYIKRIVALPGDQVTWREQKLSINGQLVPTKPGTESYDNEARRYIPQSVEVLDNNEHRILVDPTRASMVSPVSQFSGPRNACTYTFEGVSCKVPDGHYFVMGDNRDNSQDSRYWGFVPDQHLVGRAFFVWMNFGNLGRIGSFH